MKTLIPQNIVFVVTDMDKQVIEQYKIKDEKNRLRKTFRYWKKATHFSQQARYMSQRLLIRRSDLFYDKIL